MFDALCSVRPSVSPSIFEQIKQLTHTSHAMK